MPSEHVPPAPDAELFMILGQAYEDWLVSHQGQASYHDATYGIAYFAGLALSKIYEAERVQQPDFPSWERFQTIITTFLANALDHCHQAYMQRRDVDLPRRSQPTEPEPDGGDVA